MRFVLMFSCQSLIVTDDAISVPMSANGLRSFIEEIPQIFLAGSKSMMIIWVLFCSKAK